LLLDGIISILTFYFPIAVRLPFVFVELGSGAAISLQLSLIEKDTHTLVGSSISLKLTKLA